MFSAFFPGDYIESVYDVDFQKLYGQGYRVVLFDVDNTLVPHNAPADSRAMDFFKNLKDIGFKTSLISNNGSERVEKFCQDVFADGFEFKSKKPSPHAYIRATETFGYGIDETLFVGDQLFTDIWGSNNAGIRSIMVQPILKWKEEPQIVLKRFLEAIVLFFYNRHIKKYGVKSPVPIKQTTKGGA